MTLIITYKPDRTHRALLFLFLRQILMAKAEKWERRRKIADAIDESLAAADTKYDGLV